jgi:hypothetical protein
MSEAGKRTVSAVIEHMTRLADWLQANKPLCKTMTLTRQDFDLLRRHPTASNVTENDGVVYWRGFELRALPPPRKQ